MDEVTNYITEEKKKELEAELAYLEGGKRKEILEVLEYTKSLGDLKENEPYQQARSDQGQNEDRIKKIKHILQSSEVSKKCSGDAVAIGSKVTVHKKDLASTDPQFEKTYVIVGSEESDMLAGKISNTSPFGRAIIGKKRGDTFSFSTPTGAVFYQIKNVA